MNPFPGIVFHWLGGIALCSKQEFADHYKGRELKRHCFPNLFVFGCLVLELKSVSQITPAREAQLLNHLRITRQPAGCPINSGQKNSLEWKRFNLSESVTPKPLASISDN